LVRRRHQALRRRGRRGARARGHARRRPRRRLGRGLAGGHAGQAGGDERPLEARGRDGRRGPHRRAAGSVAPGPMRFADVFIRRPVFATMLVGSLVVLGLFSYGSLGLDLFPNVDFPIVTITTTLKGASVEEMETGVTKVIEEAVNTIDGIDEMRSVTKEGLSSIVVQFVLEKSRDVSAQDVRDKV